MNDVLRQLRARKSVRVFADRLVLPGVKQQVVASALEAPSAGNMLLYTILDITDSSLKEQLSVLCDNQAFIAKAPMVLIFLADYHRWYETFRAASLSPRTPGPGDMLLACADAVIAAQNTVVAAHSLGLGSCYIGDILENCERVRELLALPQYVLPAAMVVYGYPTPQQLSRQKPARVALQHIVHENTYRPVEPEGLLTTYGERGSSETLEAFCARKYMSDFSREMSRSAARYVSDFAGETGWAK